MLFRSIFIVLRSGLKFLANFTEWARRLLAALQAWWQRLFGWWNVDRGRQGEAEELAEKFTPAPFSAFRNPFLYETGAGRSPEELVCYSFDALQAWAREHGVERQPDETPLEFTERFCQETPGLETETRRLVGLYARVAYARGKIGRAHV